MSPRMIGHQDRPHIRCGICDEDFETGADTVYVDDERCHRDCAADARDGGDRHYTREDEAA